jgi:hypothetical protein
MTDLVVVVVSDVVVVGVVVVVSDVVVVGVVVVVSLHKPQGLAHNLASIWSRW